MRLGQADQSATTAEEKSLFDRTVASFMEKLRAFYDNFGAMRLQAGFVAKHPDLQNEYSGLMERGNFIDRQIKSAKALISKAQSAWDWFLSAIGLGGLGDMGVLPLLPIAVAAAAGAVVLITKWLTDVFIFSRKIEAIKALEAKGSITGQQAAGSILKAGPTGFLDVLQKNIIWIVLGGTLLMFGPEIIKIVKRRGR